MKIFFSWSGTRSKYIAETFSNWLEQVLQAVEPWISTDIEKGSRWNDDIAEKLRESKVGIICLTSDNLESKWIHFEAGAIAKTEDAYVCTFLFDINPASVQQPLSQFQSTKFTEEDVLKLIKNINTKISKAGGKALKEQNLISVYNTFWPQLVEKLKNIPEYTGKEIVPRTERELIEESLQILRILRNQISTNYLSISDENEIIDFWIDTYVKTRKLESQYSIMGEQMEDCLQYLSRIPEIRMLFGNGDKLRDKIESRMDLPF